MEFQTVDIIGLGALGAMFGRQIQRQLPVGSLRVIADEVRIRRYQTEGIFINDERVDFDYILPESKAAPADLIIFATKFSGLESAIEEAGSQVGPDTVVMSLLNGISSEEMLAEAFGAEKVLYCVAQGMDVRKVSNQVVYEHMGLISFGEKNGTPSSRVKAVAQLFERAGVAWETPDDMQQKLWSKFMLNTGVNQACMVYNTNYGGVQQPGAAREGMLSAMREVLPLAAAEGVKLSEADIDYWKDVIDGLSAEGYPSMKQDADAHRYSEVELFSGTVRQLGRKHHIATPVNDWIYEKIKEIEAKY